MGVYIKPFFKWLGRTLNHVPGYWNHQHPNFTYEQQVRKTFGRKAAKEYAKHIADIKTRGKE